MTLALTPGNESRLEGAPGVDLDQEEFQIRYRSYLQQGMGIDEAAMAAEQDMATAKAKRQQEAMAAEQRAGAAAQRERVRSGDTRSNQVLEDEAAYAAGQADIETGGYRSDGPTLRPGTPAWKARDRRMALDGAPFTRGASPDPIDDDASIRQWYEDTYGRPPQTPEEVEFARRRMISNFQTAGGQRPASQAPQRWGSREKFESQQQLDDYEDSAPGRPSELERDMMRSETPMILENKLGAAGPQIAAPGPGGVANEAFGQPARRPDLEEKGYVPTLVEGPSGQQYAYKLSPEAQEEATRKRDAFLYEQKMDRLARRAGGGYDDANLAMQLPDKLRPKGADGEDDERAMAMRQLQRAARRGYEDRKAEQIDNARRIQTENARMNSGQLGLQMQQMDPEYRQIMLLDRLTQGRRGGATPLDVQAQNMENAMPIVRSAVAGAVQGLDPAARARDELLMNAAIASKQPAEQVAISKQLGEKMGEGWSAPHVGGRWTYWTTATGAGWVGWSMEDRLEGFRREMQGQGYGYQLPEIDAYIDSRMNAQAGPGEPPEGERPPADQSNRVPVPQGGGRGRPPSAPFKLPTNNGGRGRAGTLPRSRG